MGVEELLIEVRNARIAVIMLQSSCCLQIIAVASTRDNRTNESYEYSGFPLSVWVNCDDSTIVIHLKLV